jgi:hypothetical protein
MTKTNKPKGTFDPTLPLSNPKREAFALLVVKGLTLKAAYAAAGYEGKSADLPSALRWVPEVDARIAELMKGRVDSEARAFGRRQKTKGDLLQRALRELEDIAFSDVREVVDWRREAVTLPDGETAIVDSLQARDADKIPASAAKAIKAVFLKGGALRIDMHDKRAALESIVKLLTKDGDAAPVAQNVTVNQVNVGAMDAIEAARRVAFMVAAVSQRTAAPLTIDATPAPTVQNSKDMDGDKGD